LWLRFDELGLPADRAVSLLPKEMLVTVGAHGLIVPAVLGLGAVIALNVFDATPGAVLDVLTFVVSFVGFLLLEAVLLDLSLGAELILPVVVAVAVGASATLAVHRFCQRILDSERQQALTFAVLGVFAVALVILALGLPVWPHMAIVALVALAAIAAIFGTARSPRGHRPLAWVVFVSFLLVGAAVALARTADEPKMEPVAVLLEKPSEEITGFYVGEADDRIYIAQLRHGSGLVEVSGEPVEAVVSVARNRVTRMALRSPAGLGLSDEGREQAETLLENLIAERRAASGEKPPGAGPVVTGEPARTFAPLASIHSEEPVAAAT
jgi:hypothetical protein